MWPKMGPKVMPALDVSHQPDNVYVCSLQDMCTLCAAGLSGIPGMAILKTCSSIFFVFFLGVAMLAMHNA